MTGHKSLMAAHGILARSRERKDGRADSKHSRFSRGFVAVQHGVEMVKFFPIKFLPAMIGVTSMTVRNWIDKNVITAYRMHDMFVMCEAEAAALREVVSRWHAQRNRHNDIEPAFRQEMRDVLAEVRLALDTAKLRRPLTERQQHLLRFYKGLSHGHTSPSSPSQGYPPGAEGCDQHLLH